MLGFCHKRLLEQQNKPDTLAMVAEEQREIAFDKGVQKGKTEMLEELERQIMFRAALNLGHFDHEELVDIFDRERKMLEE